MADSIGNLAVILSVGTEKWHKGFSTAEKRLKGFESSIDSSFSGIANKIALGGAAIGTALVGTVVALTKHGLSAADAISKLSTKTGVATETLAGLKLQGELADVSFEDITTAINKTNRVLGEAKFGGKDAAQSLQQLGFSVEQIGTLNTEQVLFKLADAINGTNDPAKKAAIAFQILGKQGAGIVPLLDGGTESIKRAVAEANKLGLSFSGIQGKEIEAANDAWTRVGKSIEGVGIQLAVKLAPFIEATGNKLVEFATKSGGIGSSVSAAFEVVASHMAAAADQLAVYKAGWYGLKFAVDFWVTGAIGAVELLAKALETVINALPGMHVDLTSTLDAMRLEIGKMMHEDAGEAAQALDEALSGVNAKNAKNLIAGINADAKRNAEELSKIKPAVANTFFDDSSFKAMQAAMDKAGERAKQILDDLKTPLERYNDQLDELVSLLALGKINQLEFDVAKEKLQTRRTNELPQLMQAGSVAAANFMFKQQQKTDSIPRQQLDQQKKTVNVLNDIRRNTAPGDAVEIPA